MSCRALNQRFIGLLALLGGALLLITPAAGAAAGNASAAVTPLFAAPLAHPAMPGQAGSLVRVTLALVLVLAAVFAAAWFSRRMHGVGSSRHSALEVIAQLPLGPRERAVLVRVGSQQVLLGVASGNVRALHVLPALVSPVEAPGERATVADGQRLAAGAILAQRPSFKAMLLKSLGK